MQDFRIAVLLTYQSFLDVLQWHRCGYIQEHILEWQVKHWCATLERCEYGRLHAHVMLQFVREQDRTSRSFTFEGIPPNVSSNDYLNEGIGGRNPQQSIDRGFFYVFADKRGTAHDATFRECVTGNYMPAWIFEKGVFRYRVLGNWPQALWKKYIYLTRDGVQPRKRHVRLGRRQRRKKLKCRRP